MASTDKRYPLSATDGTPIPFDIGYPLGLVILPVAVVSSAQFEFPTEATLAVIHATCDCVISFADVSPVAELTEATLLVNQLFIPKLLNDKSLNAIQLPFSLISVISADGETVGKVYINLYTPWEGLGKDLLGRRM